MLVLEEKINAQSLVFVRSYPSTFPALFYGKTLWVNRVVAFTTFEEAFYPIALRSSRLLSPERKRMVLKEKKHF